MSEYYGNNNKNEDYVTHMNDNPWYVMSMILENNELISDLGGRSDKHEDCYVSSISTSFVCSIIFKQYKKLKNQKTDFFEIKVKDTASGYTVCLVVCIYILADGIYNL